MLSSRLKERIPAARSLGKAILHNFELQFQKMSKDGSTKANIVLKEGSKVYGVLYLINNSDRQILDGIEGRGYGYEHLKVYVETDQTKPNRKIDPIVDALTYISPLDYLASTYNFQRIKWLPYNWYKKFCVDGAIEHKLPNSYIKELEKVKSKIDDGNRKFLGHEGKEWLPKFLWEIRDRRSFYGYKNYKL